jgi:hypothetical protein
MATYDDVSEYGPIWEGWTEPDEDDSRPWRLVIQPKPKATEEDEVEDEDE